MGVNNIEDFNEKALDILFNINGFLLGTTFVGLALTPDSTELGEFRWSVFLEGLAFDFVITFLISFACLHFCKVWHLYPSFSACCFHASQR